MTQYISKDKVLKRLYNNGKNLDKKNINRHFANGITTALEIINEMPAEEVRSTEYGYWWLEREPDGKPYQFHCSCCDTECNTAHNYCPNCGLKMDSIIREYQEWRDYTNEIN